MNTLNTCEKHSKKHCDCVVVYDGRECPLCEAEEVIADLNDKVDSLESALSSAENTISALEDEKSALNGQIDEMRENPIYPSPK